MERHKIFMYTTGGHGAQEGNQLDEAIRCQKNGDSVYYLNCDDSLGGCMENPHFDKALCRICMYFQGARNRKYLSHDVEQHWVREFITPEIRRKIDGITFTYRSVSELKVLKYQETDIGMGALSTYISLTRNIDPELSPDICRYFDALLRQQVILVEVLEKIFNNNFPDHIIFHNGRFAQYKPVLNLAQKYQIDFLCTESLILANGEIRKNYYVNDIPHSVIANQKKYDELWEKLASDPIGREKLARSFFENRRQALYAGDKIYTLQQRLGRLPEDWNNEKENIVIFNSSEDESCAVSEEYDKSAVFSSQLAGIKTILSHYQRDSTKHFYLRIHPNLMMVKYKYHTELNKLNYKNLTVIPADSSISTYSLLDKADKIIVFGSTVGVEASYWGKPVICLACALYKFMNIAYFPQNEIELWKYIDNPTLVALYNEDVLKYGLFYMTDAHDTNQYVSNDFKIYKLNKEYKIPAYQTWCGSNFMYIVIQSVIRRFFNLFKLTRRFKQVPICEH